MPIDRAMRGGAARGVQVLVLLALIWALPTAARAEGTAPAYEAPEGEISGTIRIVGSDTLSKILMRWAEAFRTRHPQVDIAVRSKGSGTAPPALTSGEAQIAPMSREMTDAELSTFQERHDHAPTRFTVALDAVAVYVHARNPIMGLTLRQLDQLFSAGQACGGGEAVTQWSQLVVGTALQGIALHGRDEVSGTHDFFQDKALCGGAFGADVMIHEDSAAVVDAVADDVAAIGYSGIGYLRDGVRTISIGVGDNFESARYYPIYVPGQADNPDPARRHAYVVDGRYPLSRPLFLYVNKTPGEALPAAVTAFLSFAMSREGQEIVAQSGFVPVPDGALRGERRKLEADYRPRRWWWFN